MNRRHVLATCAAAVLPLSGCLEGEQQSTHAELNLVLYNQTQQIETIDIVLRDVDEILVETTYALGGDETIATDRPIRLLTDTQYSVVIERLNGEGGVFPISPNPDRKALAIHVQDDGVIVRQEHTVPTGTS